jgi:hypothetical protein
MDCRKPKRFVLNQPRNPALCDGVSASSHRLHRSRVVLLAVLVREVGSVQSLGVGPMVYVGCFLPGFVAFTISAAIFFYYLGAGEKPRERYPFLVGD